MKKNEKIKKFVRYNGLKFVDVARDIGVSNIHLNCVLCNRRKMSNTLLQKLFDYMKPMYQSKKQQQQEWQREVEELLADMEKELKR